MWLPCVACTTIPSSHSRTSLHTIAPGGADVPGDVRTACFLVWQKRFCSLLKGAEAGQGLYAAGKCRVQGRACGPPSLALLQGGTAVEECYASRQMPPCTKTGNARLETAARCMCPRSVLHRPSEHAASAVAPQPLREVKSVPSGSEKQSLREVKSAKCKVKSGPCGKLKVKSEKCKVLRDGQRRNAHIAPAQFLIQNSAFIIIPFRIHNYHKAQFLIQNS